MILNQIESDLTVINKELKELEIEQARNPQQNTQNFELKYKLTQNILWCKTEVIRLKALLALKREPASYTSPVTNQTYIRTPLYQENIRYYSHCNKTSRKTNGKGRSKFYLHSDDGKKDIRFFMEHRADKQYPHGAFSQKVKQGFVGTETSPSYAIKILKRGIFSAANTEEIRVAMRAAYCARLLGRTGQTFRRNNKEYFITDWHPGANIAKTSKADLSTISIADRIALAIDLTRQVAILHSYGFIHCDIKPGNVVINPSAAFLIDLDSVLLKTDSLNVGITVTPQYLDSELNWHFEFGNARKELDEKSDIYALGLTLSFLFPELLNSKTVSKTGQISTNSSQSFYYRQIILEQGSEFKQHQALAELLLSLTANNKNQRPSSAINVYHALGKLSRQKYQKDYNASYNFATDPSKQSGKQAFSEIEKEILEYDDTPADLSSPIL
ncbi:MAG: protein kinase [Legionella sp.]